jgi:hypothetical protein
MSSRPDLNGMLLKSPGWGQHQIYLVDEGNRRHVPNSVVYDKLFRPEASLFFDLNVNDIDVGPQIPSNSELARVRPADEPSGKIYLIDGAKKRHITSPDAMDRYNFHWERVVDYPSNALDLIPPGPDINA